MSLSSNAWFLLAESRSVRLSITTPLPVQAGHLFVKTPASRSSTSSNDPWFVSVQPRASRGFASMSRCERRSVPPSCGFNRCLLRSRSHVQSHDPGDAPLGSPQLSPVPIPKRCLCNGGASPNARIERCCLQVRWTQGLAICACGGRSNVQAAMAWYGCIPTSMVVARRVRLHPRFHSFRLSHKVYLLRLPLTRKGEGIGRCWQHLLKLLLAKEGYM